MLPTDAHDHRRSRSAALLDAISEGDPLALAEAYHRTSAGAFACAMRLIGARGEAEQLMRATYQALWEDAPEGVPLEAWVRYRVFVEGRARLRDTERSAASPSTTLLLRDAPAIDAPLDHTERLIAGLDDDALRALLLAHDRGIPTAEQRSDAAEGGLRRALLALAEADDNSGCATPRLADHVLGLLDDDDADQVETAIASDPECASLARALRRGRRRIEGVPPPPDVGHRVIAYVLAASVAAAGLRAAEGSSAPTGEPAPSADAPYPPAPAPSTPAPSPYPPAPAPEPLTGTHADAEGGDAPGLMADEAPGAEWDDERDAAPPALEDDIPDAGPAPASVIEDEAERADEGVDVEGLRPVGPEGTEDVEPAPPSALDEMLTDLPSAPGAARYPQAPDQDWEAPAEPGGDRAPAGDDGEADRGGAGPAPVSIDDRGRGDAAWGSGQAKESDEDRLRFEEGSDFDEGEGGRRALTIVLTILGGLLLLAAGAVAGLLAIRIFVG